MIIHLCKKAIDRLAGAKPMISSLREAEHSIVVKDCLDRCQACDRGLLIASADGMPLSAPDPATLLSTVAELGED